MTYPTFSNSDLQRDSLGDTLQFEPTDIKAFYDANLDVPHGLDLLDRAYFYAEEFNRDHDRDLAMALLLTGMQDNDGVSIIATVDGNEFSARLTSIAEEEGDGSIYVTVVDQEDDSHDINVTDLTVDGFPMPAASPATVETKTLKEREDETLDNSVEHTRLGDYVETTVHGHRGRVVGIDGIFADTGHTNFWFRQQKPAYDKADKLQRWVSILVDGSGSVLVAEDRVKLVEKFDFSNPYADEYFRETPTFTAEQIEFIKKLAKPLVDDGENREYTRGICELIADIDCKSDMAQRAEEIKAELVN